MFWSPCWSRCFSAFTQAQNAYTNYTRQFCFGKLLTPVAVQTAILADQLKAPANEAKVWSDCYLANLNLYSGTGFPLAAAAQFVRAWPRVYLRPDRGVGDVEMCEKASKKAAVGKLDQAWSFYACLVNLGYKQTIDWPAAH